MGKGTVKEKDAACVCVGQESGVEHTLSSRQALGSVLSTTNDNKTATSAVSQRWRLRAL